MTWFVLLIVPMLGVLLVGGMILNAFNPAYNIVECPFMIGCAVPQLGNFIGMTYLLLNPVQQYITDRWVKDVRGISVCDKDKWSNAHGVYFTDGDLAGNVITQGVTATLSPTPAPLAATLDRRLVSRRSVWLNVQQCQLQKDGSSEYWRSCQVAVAPIFGGNEMQKACAWAIAEAAEPAKPECGMLSSGGICGTIADYANLRVLQQGGSGRQELFDGIAKFAAEESIAYDKDVPLIKLGSPLAAEQNYFLWYLALAILLFTVYIPLPLCFFACVVAGVRNRDIKPFSEHNQKAARGRRASQYQDPSQYQETYLEDSDSEFALTDMCVNRDKVEHHGHGYGPSMQYGYGPPHAQGYA